jgi:hypothetical protein
VLLLPLAQCEGHLGPAVLEVELERHQGQAALLDGADQLLDLAPVKEELAGADGVMIVAVALLVRSDVHAFEKYLTVLYPGVGFADRGLSVPEGLHLGPREHDAGLPGLEYMVVMGCLGVAGNRLSPVG